MSDTFVSTPGIRPLDDGLNAEAGLLFVCGGEHPLFVQREGPHRVAYKFVSVADVARAFAWENADTGWLPRGLCRWGRTRRGNFAVWHVPPATYSLQLHRLPEAVAAQGIKTVTVPLPGLVLIGSRRSYRVFALRDEFAPQAPLFHAPLPNVYPSGEICLGANTPPALDEPVAIAAAWNLFLESPFNADLVSGKSRSYPNDVRLLLLRLNGRRRFPPGELTPAGYPSRTVEDALKNIVSEREDPLPRVVQRLVSPDPAEREAALAEQMAAARVHDDE
jgi:PRTRC genetic system protein B